MTPLRVPGTPSYTWELTSPVNGRSSGMYVLHIGSTPQTSPMSRDPPNVIVNQRQLMDVLHGKVSRGQRGHGEVRRHLQDPIERVEPIAGSSRGVRGAVGHRQGGGVVESYAALLEPRPQQYLRQGGSHQLLCRHSGALLF